MEGVGARFGRSSTRYGPSSTVTVAFTGPVRKWKKKWVPESPSPNNLAASLNHHHSQTANHNDDPSSTNGNNGSHLLLYKWTPITQSKTNSNSSNGDNNNSAKDDAAATNSASAVEEPPRRRFKYIPIAVLENEAAEKSDIEAHAAEPISRNDGLDEKPDINDMPIDETQALGDTPLARQDLNESTLDLSLGLNGHDGDPDSDVKTNRSEDSLSEK